MQHHPIEAPSRTEAVRRAVLSNVAASAGVLP
jgi:hypothetical protein